MAEPKRKRKGILETLTSDDGGFGTSNLRVISGQISQIQQGPPVEAEATPEPADLDTAPPPPSPQTPDANAEASSSSVADLPLLVPPVRTKGTRDAKVTGLHLVLQDVQEHGFPHPLGEGSFLMVPRVFKALLALEPLSVIQVVFEVLDQTIGWADVGSNSGRREWCELSLRHFELSCGMTRSQAQRGIKRALNHKYILRRSHGSSFEYAIRWNSGALSEK